MNDDNKTGIVFGAVDIIITLLGVIIGLSVSGDQSIILTGIILVGISDAFANASGIYATTHIDDNPSILPGIYCFTSTIFVMFILLLPFIIYPLQTAVYISVTISLILLTYLGYYTIPENSTNTYKTPLRILFTGVVVSIICYIIGTII